MKRTIRVERWLSVVAGVVYLSVPTPLVAGPEWSASQVIGPPATNRGEASVVGVDGDGDIVLAWRTPEPGLELLDAVRAGVTVPVRWAVRPSGGTFTVDPAPAFETPCCVDSGMRMAVSARGDVFLRSIWGSETMEHFGSFPPRSSRVQGRYARLAGTSSRYL